MLSYAKMRVSSVKVALWYLSICASVNGRAISQQTQESDDTEFLPQRRRTTKSSGNPSESLMRILMKLRLRASSFSTTQEESDPTSKFGGTRPKRSFYFYPNNHQQQWPQIGYTNTWVSAPYPLQNPVYVSMGGYGGSVSNYNLKYTFLKTTEHQPRRTPSNFNVNSMKTSFLRTRSTGFSRGKMGEERPIWDVSEYQPKHPQFSRSLKSSKGELFQGEERSFLGENEENDSDIFSDEAPMEDNEIPKFPLEKPMSTGPSRCSWAILSCCSTSSEHVNLECFKEVGCEGPFWDVKVCSLDYQKAAIQAALDFYGPE